jgi:hypothetical protein
VAESCLFCARDASVPLDRMVGPWACDRCLRRLAKVALEEPPASLVELWPVAEGITEEMQRQFRDGTIPRPEHKTPWAQEEWDPASRQWVSHDREVRDWPDHRLCEVAEMILGAPAPQGMRPGAFRADFELRWVLGTDAHKAFLAGEDCRGYALFAAARGLSLEPVTALTAPDDKLAAARARLIGRMLARRTGETADRDARSAGFRVLLHPRVAAEGLVDATRRRWFKS